MDKIFESDGFFSIETWVCLSEEVYDRILQTSRDLDISFDAVLMAVVNTSVRRHFDNASSQEVPE